MKSSAFPKFAASIVIACLAGHTAMAGDNAREIADEAEGRKCFEAKDIVKMAAKFQAMKPEKTDTVSAEPEMVFVSEDGFGNPERMFFRLDETQIPFTIAPDGQVSDFAKVGSLEKDGEICIEDGRRKDLPEEERKVSAEMDFDILFKNRSGTHSLAELEDGLKDGKSHYKKMFGGPMSLFVPKMTHVVVEYAADAENGAGTVTPDIYAAVGGMRIDGLKIQPFDIAYWVDVSQLEALGADSLRIDGGPYTMAPTPSIEKLESLGFFDEDEEGAEEEVDK